MVTQQLLDIIEDECNVRMVYCCESGSRAWGFPSQDSDFDVRFIYVRPTETYLSIMDAKDVVEYSNDGILDINGWDIRKALRLFFRSNCTLYEWLQSPVIYRKMPEFTSELCRLARHYFSPKTGAFHYLGLTKSIYPSLIEVEHVSIKKYFYVLRTLLAGQWIVNYETYPPMTLDDLMEIVKNSAIREIITELRQRKSEGTESTTIPVISTLNAYLAFLYENIREAVPYLETNTSNNVEPLNEIFRTMIQQYAE